MNKMDSYFAFLNTDLISATHQKDAVEDMGL